MLIIGVRFKDAGKVYYFNPDKIEQSLLVQGTPVIVETARGAEYGIVAMERREVDETTLSQPIKKVVRIATENDTRQQAENRKREDEAREICLKKIKDHNLEMNLVNVELTFDLNKIIFFFTADGRVDFRELVKDLASTFRMRIELRQIGVRDEAKMISGIGICGRVLCCASFLDEFQPVSIKSAKDQGLSLNPTKISGICGKLMCCLKYEEETYAHLMKGMPGVGDLISTPLGNGDVLSINILKQTIKASVKPKPQEDAVVEIFPLGEIKILEHRPQCERNCNCPKCRGNE